MGVPAKNPFRKNVESKYAPCAAEALEQNVAHARAMQMLADGRDLDYVVPFLRTEYGRAARTYRNRSNSVSA